MDAQSESCEAPSDPQAAGKIRKAFKLFGKGKPVSGVASIFSRRAKGEGPVPAPAPAPVPRSKTLDGLSESAAAAQEAPEAATVSEPTASPQPPLPPQPLLPPQQEGGVPEPAGQSEQPWAGQPAGSSPTRPSISSITSAKSLGFLSLLRRGRRGGGACGGGGAERQAHTETHRGGRQRKGLRSLFGSVRWRHRDDEPDEGAGPPLTASRSNSVEIIKEHLTLTPRPPPRPEAEPTPPPHAPPSQADASKAAAPRPAGAEPQAASQLSTGAEPASDRLSTLLGDISSILSFDSLTGCGDIVADVEAEWAKASSRVGASARQRADDTDSTDKSLSSSATPSGKLSPAPTPTPLTPAPPTSPPQAKPSSPAPTLAPAPVPSPSPAPTPTPPAPVSTDTKAPPSPPSAALRGSAPLSKPEPKPAPAPAQAMPAPPKAPPPAAPRPASSTLHAAKVTSGQVGGAKPTGSGKPPPKIITTFGLSCNRARTSPPTNPAPGPAPDAKPPTPTAKSAPVSTFSDSALPAAIATEAAPPAKGPMVAPAPPFSAPPAPAAYKPPPSYSFPEPSPVAPAPPSCPPPVASPASPPSPLAPPAVPLSQPPCASSLGSSTAGRPQPAPPSSPEEEARVGGGEELALREAPGPRGGAQGRREEPPAEPPSAPGARGDRRSPAVKPASLSKIPVSGGGRPGAGPGAGPRGPREVHSNGDHAASTPPGSEEDTPLPLPAPPPSESPATTPPTSPLGVAEERPHTPSPPGASAPRCSSKGAGPGIPRDSKIPIKRDTHATPTYHSLQGKADAPRTKIPVSKVPVRRGGHAAARK